MNKILLPALLILAAATPALAQPALYAVNSNPAIGDEFISVVCDTTGVLQGAAGASMTWHFESLDSTASDTGMVVACSSTSYCGLYSGSTMATIEPHGTVINYFLGDGTHYTSYGTVVNSTTGFAYTNPADIFQYPSTGFTYLDSFTDSYSGVLQYSGTYFPQAGTEKVVADGWGTLKLPRGITYSNVLRVHTSQLYVDTAHLFGSTTTQTFQFDSYDWYMPNYHSPLLTVSLTQQVDGSFHSKVVSYSSVWVTANGVPTVASIGSSFMLFPNPATSELNVKFSTAGSEQVRITLVDLLGREVAVLGNGSFQGQQNISCNTAAYPRGIYLVRLQSGTETITRKIELQ